MHFMQLLVLLWKNWILHRRHYFTTIFEILSPVLLSLILFHSLLSDPPTKAELSPHVIVDYNSTTYKSFNPFHHIPFRSYLFYVPDTPSAKELMKTAFKRSPLIIVVITRYSSERILTNERFARVRNRTWGTVIFENFNGSVIPPSLQYRINLNPWLRYNMDPPDRTYYQGSINKRLEAESPYRKGGFLAMQLMIDRAYITLRRRKRGLAMPRIQFRVKRIPIPKFSLIETPEHHLFIDLIPFYVCTGFLLFFVVVVKRVVDEKNNRAKEMMKMMGMSTTDYWGSVFFTNFLLAMVICTILTIVYSIPVGGEYSVLHKISPSLFFIVMLIYCASSLLLCFIISVIFTKSVISVTMTVILWVSTTTIATSFVTLNEEMHTKMISCLLPNLAMKLIFLMAYRQEVAGVGVGWDNTLQSTKKSQDDFSVGSVILMMLLSCVLYAVLLLYLDAIWPWQPGISKPPLFFLDESFWYPEHNIAVTGFSNTAPVKSKYFEEEINDVIPTIVIHRMSKEYGMRTSKKLAVDDLSLNIFHGQITVLLGPNGAGKTTTINALSGIFPPTSGTAIINGCDIVKETNEARSNLGFCPEYAVLYDHLTIEEHLKLFAGLKGRRWWALAAEITYILRWLQLLGKLQTLSKNLSAGMQRKLSLANAVIGNPEILILDEPTTGLDPESRLCVWNLLEQLRPTCTILLTTNSMEEADVLGDRIAIMASGRLQCCGSSMFLKRIFGAGYHLRIEKDTNCQVDAITEVIRHHVSEAKLTHNIEFELIYFLSNEAKSFIELFRQLENSYQQLGIQSCGIDVTTMDEVFMRVAQMSEEHFQMHRKSKEYLEKNIGNTGSLFKQPSSKLRDGCTILETLQQMEALLFKRAQYAKRDIFLLMYQFVFPLIAILLFIYLDDAMMIYSTARISNKFTFDMCRKFEQIKYGVFTIRGNESNIHSLGQYYEDTLLKHCVNPVKISDTTDLEEFFLSRKFEEITTYAERYLIGANMSESEGNFSITSWYNGIHYHLDPISLNLITNALLRFLTNDDNAKIHVAVRLYTKPKSHGEEFKHSTSLKESFNVVFLPMGLTILSSSFVLFLVQERVSKLKLLQRMCGISGTTYWLMNFLWDFLIHMFSSLLMTITFAVYCEQRNIISFDAVGEIFLLLLLYGFSSIPLTYIASLIVTVPSSGFVSLTLLNMLVGISGIVAVTTMKGTVEVSKAMWFLRLFPNFSASWGIKNIYILSKHNLECIRYEKESLYEECKTIDHYCCTDSVEVGEGYVKLPYYSWDDQAAGKERFALILMSFIWSGLTIFLETNIVEKIGVFILDIKFIKDVLKPYTEKRHTEDSDVLDESKRVENLIISKTFQEEALLTFKLTKNFRSLCAVDNLTFSVHKEECFGLLGINGAGKTTTFRMLTGDLVPSSGNAYIQQFSVEHSLKKLQMAIGYCPQNDALLDRLNTQEMLQLFARLRGIPRNDIENNVNTIISMCDLEEVRDKETSSFSGGMKRKLSLAMTLIGAPPVILLDEPTSGIDPVSRRKMWQTLTTMKNTLGLSYILTSHSMDECETLCNRVAIMVNGEFRCLETMRNLKSKFGKGYTIIAKLKQPTTLLQELKEFLLENIPLIQLKEDFHGTLHYHTTDTSLKWSKMFTILETAKDKFGLEDYVVSGTRLEQIFLTFARDQRTNV